MVRVLAPIKHQTRLSSDATAVRAGIKFHLSSVGISKVSITLNEFA